ncbi:MAG: hypothetical protein RL385_5121 [Pseudomonadota bacterium]
MPLKKHVFVCLQNRPLGHARGSCQGRGSPGVYQAFVDELEQRGLKDEIRLTHSGCLGPCQGGPSVLVYPEGVLYSQVHPDDVSAIVQQHLLDGQPLARLALQQW